MTSVSNLAMEEELAAANEEILAKTTEALEKLEERIAANKEERRRLARGPRNLPQPDARKRRRQAAKAARKANR